MVLTRWERMFRTHGKLRVDASIFVIVENPKTGSWMVDCHREQRTHRHPQTAAIFAADRLIDAVSFSSERLGSAVRGKEQHFAGEKTRCAGSGMSMPPLRRPYRHPYRATGSTFNGSDFRHRHELDHPAVISFQKQMLSGNGKRMSEKSETNATGHQQSISWIVMF